MKSFALMLSVTYYWFTTDFYHVSECLSLEQVGRLENAIGWYHSHPGYGCWLSGIDVSTQMLNQQFQEPFVAIVVSQWFSHQIKQEKSREVSRHNWHR